jgi:hypothetical protein
MRESPLTVEKNISDVATRLLLKASRDECLVIPECFEHSEIEADSASYDETLIAYGVSQLILLRTWNDVNEPPELNRKPRTPMPNPDVTNSMEPRLPAVILH